MYNDETRNNDFAFFLNEYDALFEKYGHKFFVIKKKAIIGVYDSYTEAINKATKKYPLGSFIIQECTGDETGYTNYISSWQLVNIG